VRTYTTRCCTRLDTPLGWNIPMHQAQWCGPGLLTRQRVSIRKLSWVVMTSLQCKVCMGRKLQTVSYFFD